MKQRIILLVIISLLAAPAHARGQQLKDTVVVAISNDFRPFTFLNDEGKPAGMLVDIWRLWALKTGRNVAFSASDWNTSLTNLANQQADIHSGLIFTPELFPWMSVSRPFYEAGVNVFAPLESSLVSDLDKLSGQTLAVVRGGYQQHYLQEKYPAIRLFACDTREELVKASQHGTTMGFVALSQVGTAVIDRMGVSGSFEAKGKPLYKEKFHAGVVKANTQLLALIDQGFNAISQQELAEIEARWIPDPTQRYYQNSGMVQLSPEETAWLQNHKTIRVGMSPVIPPLKFIDKGVVRGIEPDYLRLFSEYTGIRFEYVIGEFSAMDAKVQSGELDMFLSFYIPERLPYMTFTEPTMEFKQVIITRADAPFMSGIGSLKGKKVATVKGVKLYEKLLRPYPEIETIAVDSSEEMFKAVSESKADALLSRTYIAGYLIQNFPNLKIAGIADLPPEPYLYAIRKDYPQLVSILNKAIASISRDEHDAIVQKWFSFRIEYRPNWSEILKWALVIGGMFILLLVAVLTWNRRLSMEIGKRRQAEEQQRKTTERLSLACYAGGIGIWELDLVTNRLLWDDQMLALYGLTPDAFGGTYEAWCASVHPEDLQETQEAMQLAVQGGKNFDADFRIVRPDGITLVVHALAIVKKDASGQTITLIGTNYDITERKRAEEERRLFTEELARSNIDLQRFAYVASHDLQEPLRMISSYLQLIERRYKDQLDDHANTFIHYAVDGAHRLQTLIKGLLEFSRIHTHGKSLTAVDVAAVLKSVCRNLQPLIAETGAVVHYREKEMSVIQADASQLSQLFQNLLHNGLKFRSKGVSPIIEITAVKTDAGRIFCVRDNGIGIEQQYFERIFTIFQRLHTREEYPGTGIGLSICQRIVERHHGKIWLESSTQTGTSFYFSIPESAH